MFSCSLSEKKIKVLLCLDLEEASAEHSSIFYQKRGIIFPKPCFNDFNRTNLCLKPILISWFPQSSYFMGLNHFLHHFHEVSLSCLVSSDFIFGCSPSQQVPVQIIERLLGYQTKNVTVLLLPHLIPNTKIPNYNYKYIYIPKMDQNGEVVDILFKMFKF